jgi:hypothetical protein
MDIIFASDMGPVVKVAGICYEYISSTAVPVTHQPSDVQYAYALCNTCADPSGACCFGNGTCQFITSGACAGSGGAWQGEGTDCSPNLCPQPPKYRYVPCPDPSGACCHPDGTCTTVPVGICSSTGGIYQGDGVVCYAGLCPSSSSATIYKCRTQWDADYAGGVYTYTRMFTVCDTTCTPTGWALVSCDSNTCTAKYTQMTCEDQACDLGNPCTGPSYSGLPPTPPECCSSAAPGTCPSGPSLFCDNNCYQTLTAIIPAFDLTPATCTMTGPGIWSKFRYTFAGISDSLPYNGTCQWQHGFNFGSITLTQYDYTSLSDCQNNIGGSPNSPISMPINNITLSCAGGRWMLVLVPLPVMGGSNFYFYRTAAATECPPGTFYGEGDTAGMTATVALGA